MKTYQFIIIAVSLLAYAGILLIDYLKKKPADVAKDFQEVESKLKWYSGVWSRLRCAVVVKDIYVYDLDRKELPGAVVKALEDLCEVKHWRLQKQNNRDLITYKIER